jgi:hypothetical protein
MRFLVFLCGLSILALGLAAPRALPPKEGMAFLSGALTLGGGLVISGLFAIRWFWHGLMGAGVLALLGMTRGFGNLPGLVRYLGGQRENGPLPVLEAAATVISLLLLVAVVKTLFAEKRRRAIAELENAQDDA